MLVKNLYLIRHGQTEFNKQGIVQGCGVNSDLNDEGRAQASAFFEAYRHVSFDKVYTSALKRSQQSVELFVRQGVPFEPLAGLNEISWGTNEGKRITPDEDAYYHWMLQQWQLGHVEHRIEGGESPLDVALRQREALDLILSRTHEQNVLICMHGRALRILLCQLLRYPLRSMDMFEHQNLGLYQVTYSGSMFSVVRYNDGSHLQRLESSRVPDPALTLISSL
ncbi:MAG: histidine phosphatase family protein [Flammeovirgaceae bacterium]|nr:histidine phosphatase family protein [Flammeovirgaceae bacterium]